MLDCLELPLHSDERALRQADAIKAETDSQKAYETFVKDTNGSIEEKNRDITNKSELKATAEADKTASEEAKETAMNEQQQNKNEEADLHKSCDFVLKNFDIRQAARDQEVRRALALAFRTKSIFLIEKS